VNLTKSQLKQIIQEELISTLLQEGKFKCYEDPKGHPRNPNMKIFKIVSQKTRVFCSNTGCFPVNDGPWDMTQFTARACP
jgi:hypothetical protein